MSAGARHSWLLKNLIRYFMTPSRKSHYDLTIIVSPPTLNGWIDVTMDIYKMETITAFSDDWSNLPHTVNSYT